MLTPTIICFNITTLRYFVGFKLWCKVTNIQHQSNVGGWCQATVEFWIHFQQKCKVCPVLEVDVNAVFISNQNAASVQSWRLTSSQRWVLTSTWFLFSAEMQRLSNVGGWSQADISFWHQPDFHHQPKCSVCPMLEVDVKPVPGFDVNTIFNCPVLAVDLKPIFIFDQNSVSVRC